MADTDKELNSQGWAKRRAAQLAGEAAPAPTAKKAPAKKKAAARKTTAAKKG